MPNDPSADRARTWVSDPELDDERVREATGLGWDGWCDLIEAWPRRDEGHTAVARHLVEEHEVDGWWAQAVTVGWERITGRRRVGQMADGTFTANRSRTLDVDAQPLRDALLDDVRRAELLGVDDTELRSSPTSKALRVAMSEGVALFAIDERPDGRVKLTVAHEKLPDDGSSERWKGFWSDWLEGLGASG